MTISARGLRGLANTSDFDTANQIALAVANAGSTGFPTTTAITTAIGGTLTAAGIVSKNIIRSGPTAAFSDATDTAVAIVAALPSAAAGQSFYLNVKNTTAFNETITAGAGVTLAGLVIIPPNSTGLFLVQIVSLTAVTITGIATFSAEDSLPANLDNTVATGTGTMVAGAMEGATNVSLIASGQAAITLTTRTAAQIQAGVPNWQVGQTYRLRIVNLNSGTLTIAGGSNVTFTATIPKNNYSDFTVLFATATTITVAQITTGPVSALLAVGGVAAGYKIARGVATTASASDTIVSGLATVVAVIVSPQADLSVDLLGVTATIGDQAGTPAAGSFLLKSWKVTTGGAAGNPTPVAATTFTQAVNWLCIGT